MTALLITALLALLLAFGAWQVASSKGQTIRTVAAELTRSDAGLVRGLKLTKNDRAYRCNWCNRMQKPGWMVYLPDSVQKTDTIRDVEIIAESQGFNGTGSGVCLGCAPKDARRTHADDLAAYEDRQSFECPPDTTPPETCPKCGKGTATGFGSGGSWPGGEQWLTKFYSCKHGSHSKIAKSDETPTRN